MPIIILPPYKASSVAAGTGKSVNFNGVNDYIEFPYQSAYSFGTGDWTMECFVRFNTVSSSLTQTLMGFGNGGGSASPYLLVRFNGTQLTLEEATASAGTAASFNSTWSPNVATWYHVAVVRASNVITMYVDGASIGSKSYTGAQLDSMNCVIGATHYGSQGYISPISGLMSNVRITKSAVYTTTFTRPASALTAIANTVLLTCQGDTISDNSTLAVSPLIGGSPFVDTRSPWDSSTTAPSADAIYDPYINNVVSALHFNGANAGTVIDDSSGYQRTYTAGTGITTSTTQKKFGTASASFTSTGVITTPASNDFVVGTGDFTIEGWAYFTGYTNATATGVFTLGAGFPAGPSNALAVGLVGQTGAWQMYCNTNYNTSGITSPLNTWHHWALVRSSGVTSLYINGVLGVSATDTTNYSGSTLSIGAIQSSTYRMTGYIDDFRFTKGVARYTAAFNPPTTTFADTFSASDYDPMYDRVTLLLNGENGITDVTGKNTFDSVSTAGTSTVITRFPGGKSLYFDGTTTTRLVSSGSTLAAVTMASGIYCIDFWIYPLAYAASAPEYRYIWSAPLNAYSIRLNNTGILSFWNNTGRLFSSAAIPLNQWTHVAIQTGNTSSGVKDYATIFINGVPQTGSTQVNFATAFSNSGSWAVGGYYDGTSTTGTAVGFNGYLDDFRFTRDGFRYGAAFTPIKAPAAPSGLSKVTAYDPYAKNVVLQLRMEGTAGTIANSDTTSVVDDTGKTLTAFTGTGATAKSFDGSVVKYGSTSLKLNGGVNDAAHQDYLTTPYSSDFAFGTGDFTVEGWIYLNAYQNTDRCTIVSNWHGGVGASCAWLLGVNSGGYANFQGNNNAFSLTSPTVQVPLNQWTHLAFCRDGVNGTLYMNGKQVQRITTMSTTAMFTGDLPIGIGGDPSGFWTPNGYIDDVRVTKGVCRYKGEFTPPTAQLPLLTSTEYATRYSSDTYAGQVVAAVTFDGVVPTDACGGSITNTNVVIDTTLGQPVTQFVDSGGGYFNGSAIIQYSSSSNYAMGTSNWTLEAWVYPTARPGSGDAKIIANYTSGSSGEGIFLAMMPAGTVRIGNAGSSLVGPSTQVLPLNTWSHVAAVRSGNILYLFVNGTLVGTNASYSTSITHQAPSIGGAISTSFFTGFIDDARFTLGAARYTKDFVPSPTAFGYSVVADPSYTNVSLLIPFDSGVADLKGHTTNNTGVTINTTTKKMGVGSGRFNGSSYVDIPAGADFDYGTSPFTIEGWFNADSVSVSANPIFSLANRGFLFQLQNAAYVFYINGVASGWAGNAGTAVAGAWAHFALVRNASNVCTLYINGVATGSTPTHSEALGSSTSTIRLGGDATGGTFFTGYLDDIRITKGVARYTQNFTVPQAAYPSA